jgi:hypothetical protein
MDQRTVEIVSDAFIVIVGVAVERFLTDYPLGHEDPAFQRRVSSSTKPNKTETVPCPAIPKETETVEDGWYWLCYTLALMVLVTLALRFLIGGNSDLAQTYVTPETTGTSIKRFITDVCFLMFFAAFLVGAALSKSVRAFMGWLSLSSAVGVIWTVAAHGVRQQPHLSPWYLHIGLLMAFAACLVGMALSSSVRAFMSWLAPTAVVGTTWSVFIYLGLRKQDAEFSSVSLEAMLCLLSLGLYRFCVFRRDRRRSGSGQPLQWQGTGANWTPNVLFTAYIVTGFPALASACCVIGRTIASGARGAHGMIFWWLAVNFAQFAISSGLYLFCDRLRRQPEGGKVAVRWVLGIAAVWYVLFIFVFDLQVILSYNPTSSQLLHHYEPPTTTL